eukprot:scaffold4309_cov215-Pinguiococcus_pyrenoidosus.AAC.2
MAAKVLELLLEALELPLQALGRDPPLSGLVGVGLDGRPALLQLLERFVLPRPLGGDVVQKLGALLHRILGSLQRRQAGRRPLRLLLRLRGLGPLPLKALFRFAHLAPLPRGRTHHLRTQPLPVFRKILQLGHQLRQHFFAIRGELLLLAAFALQPGLLAIEDLDLLRQALARAPLRMDLRVLLSSELLQPIQLRLKGRFLLLSRGQRLHGARALLRELREQQEALLPELGKVDGRAETLAQPLRRWRQDVSDGEVAHSACVHQLADGAEERQSWNALLVELWIVQRL